MDNNKLVPRQLKESDWETLQSWWDFWPGVETPPRDFLPDNGTGGIMIEDNGKPVVAGFIYQTNSSGAMLEWVISSPNYRGKKKRDKALYTLTISLQTMAKDLGCKIIFANIQVSQIINLGKRLGWKIDPKPNYTHIKIL
tara:strand:- start:11619 stop:12038 length:420 start_codon:yes stop_codon:yes gene_type:complete